MKKFVWPLLIVFFLLGGLAAILIGQVVLPPEPRPESVEVISEKWTESGHADAESESFVHWDEEEVPEVPANCAKCHSGIGYLDFLGEDGSAPVWLILRQNWVLWSAVLSAITQRLTPKTLPFILLVQKLATWERQPTVPNVIRDAQLEPPWKMQR